MNEQEIRELRERMEVRIVAVLLGEASAFETAEIEQATRREPDLAAFHAEMRRTIDLTREASKQLQAPSQPAAEPPKLSPERREALLARFKQRKVAAAPVSRPARRHYRWLVPASLAAGFVVFLGLISLPHFHGKVATSAMNSTYAHFAPDVVGLDGGGPRGQISGQLSERSPSDLPSLQERLEQAIPKTRIVTEGEPLSRAPARPEMAVQAGTAPRVYLPKAQTPPRADLEIKVPEAIGVPERKPFSMPSITTMPLKPRAVLDLNRNGVSEQLGEALLLGAQLSPPHLPPLQQEAEAAKAAGKSSERVQETLGEGFALNEQEMKVRLRDVQTGKPITEPLKLQAGVNSAAFTPDAKRMVPAPKDSKSGVWDRNVRDVFDKEAIKEDAGGLFASDEVDGFRRGGVGAGAGGFGGGLSLAGSGADPATRLPDILSKAPTLGDATSASKLGRAVGRNGAAASDDFAASQSPSPTLAWGVRDKPKENSETMPQSGDRSIQGIRFFTRPFRERGADLDGDFLKDGSEADKLAEINRAGQKPANDFYFGGIGVVGGPSQALGLNQPPNQQAASSYILAPTMPPSSSAAGSGRSSLSDGLQVPVEEPVRVEAMSKQQQVPAQGIINGAMNEGRSGRRGPDAINPQRLPSVGDLGYSESKKEVSEGVTAVEKNVEMDAKPQTPLSLGAIEFKTVTGDQLEKSKASGRQPQALPEPVIPTIPLGVVPNAAVTDLSLQEQIDVEAAARFGDGHLADYRNVPARRLRGDLASKLDQIRLDSFQADGLPLGEVMRSLNEQAKQRDLDNRGVRFGVNIENNSANATASIIPSTGLPPLVGRELLDLSTTTINLKTPLTNVTLREALEAVQKVADRPIQYSVDDSGVRFSWKAPDYKNKEEAPTPKAAPSVPPTPQPEITTGENAFSTFSLNVSDVSFKLAAGSLENNTLPDPASIRVEEFVNAFNYHDPAPQGSARMAFAWERARYPFAHNREILRFAVQTAARGREPQKPLNLVVLLDNSGSMERPDRVQIVHEALKVLAQRLQPQDRISVVAFARTARLWVDGLAGGKPKELLDKVLELNPDGGTNLEDALGVGYATAARHFMADGINRVILLTDGAANLGNVESEVLKQKVVTNRLKGIALDCFGIGWEGYNDDLLEVLTHNGDGRYGFFDHPEEAAPEFANQLAGALNVAAADVKTQVEFNPGRVLNWRQIGYAKHQLTKEQFRDNTVDAAELAAAESGNALYAVQVNPEGSGPLGVVRVRYKIPASGQYVEQAWTIPYQPKVAALDEASPAMRLAVTAAAFGEWLSRSPYAGEVTPAALQPYLNGVSETYAPDPRPERLAAMIRQAQALTGK